MVQMPVTAVEALESNSRNREFVNNRVQQQASAHREQFNPFSENGQVVQSSSEVDASHGLPQNLPSPSSELSESETFQTPPENHTQVPKRTSGPAKNKANSIIKEWCDKLS